MLGKKGLILAACFWLTFFISSNFLETAESSSAMLNGLQFGRLITKAGFGFGREDALIVVGDVMLGRDVEKKMRTEGLSYPFLSTKEYLKAKVVLGNFEASIPEIHVPTPALGMVFSVLEDNLESAAKAGFTHFSLANNHTYDHEAEGFAHTKEALNLYGFEFFGDPQTVSSSSVQYIEIGGVPVALFAINAVGGFPSRTEWNPVLEVAKRGSDLQMVYVHFGEEYQGRHNRAEQEFAHALVDAGVDLVIGHHPHVVQDIEQYNQTPIFYSLGNFVFDQYFSDEVAVGLMLRITLAGRKGEIELIPVDSRDTPASPKIMHSRDRSKFLNELARKSSPSLYEGIESGKLSFGY